MRMLCVQSRYGTYVLNHNEAGYFDTKGISIIAEQDHFCRDEVCLPVVWNSQFIWFNVIHAFSTLQKTSCSSYIFPTNFTTLGEVDRMLSKQNLLKRMKIEVAVDQTQNGNSVKKLVRSPPICSVLKINKFLFPLKKIGVHLCTLKIY